MKQGLLLWLLVGCCLAVRVNAVLDAVPSAGAGGPLDMRGYVRFVSLLPADTPVALYFDTRQVADNVRPDSGAGYRAVMARTYEAAVRRAGSGPAGKIVAEQPVQLTPLYYYTLIVYGSAESPQLAFLDDNPKLPSHGMSRLRLFNAVPGAGMLALRQSGQLITATTGEGEASPYQQVKLTASLDIAASAAAAPFFRLPALPGSARVFTAIIYRHPRETTVRTLVLVERTN